MATKWEYVFLVMSDSGENVGKKFNELGDQGWKLVAVTPETPNRHPVAFFKRPKTS